MGRHRSVCDESTQSHDLEPITEIQQRSDGVDRNRGCALKDSWMSVDSTPDSCRPGVRRVERVYGSCQGRVGPLAGTRVLTVVDAVVVIL